MTIVCPAGIDVTHYLRRVQRRLGGDQQGFSLIELLVVILVAGVMMAAILGLLLGGIRVFASEGVRMQNQDDVRLGTVSYTHLRAHETVLDLVCRLLLEKKNKHIKKEVIKPLHY